MLTLFQNIFILKEIIFHPITNEDITTKQIKLFLIFLITKFFTYYAQELHIHVWGANNSSKHKGTTFWCYSKLLIIHGKEGRSMLR